MFDKIIPLIASWLPIFDEYLIFALAGVVIMFVPVLVYSFFRG